MQLFLKATLVVAAAISQTGGKSVDPVQPVLPSATLNRMAEVTGSANPILQKGSDSLMVLLDSYFNNEKRKDKGGNLVSTHYKWNQKDLGGYSRWGDVFNSMGAATEMTTDPPSKATLKNAAIYIITDPDIPKENKDAKFMTKAYAEVIARWVAKGGVLVLMENDKGNADIEHFNLLAKKFGFFFNEDSYNHVNGRAFDSGGVDIASGNMIFKKTKRVYIKELSTIQPTGSVQTVLEKKGHIIAVSARYGKGTVFAVGDPWFYNEYVDGKRLPASFENEGAMKEFTNWLILQTDPGHKD